MNNPGELYPRQRPGQRSPYLSFLLLAVLAVASAALVVWLGRRRVDHPGGKSFAQAHRDALAPYRADSPAPGAPDTQAPPPGYLEGKTGPERRGGPADLLLDGNWCGHGEPKYAVFVVHDQEQEVFEVRIGARTEDDVSFPPVVQARRTAKDPNPAKWFTVYDPRKHPASLFASPEYESKEPRFDATVTCPKCGRTHFRLAVGFEFPTDSEGPDDTSWFALAIECEQCHWRDIVFEDETA